MLGHFNENAIHILETHKFYYILLVYKLIKASQCLHCTQTREERICKKAGAMSLCHPLNLCPVAPFSDASLSPLTDPVVISPLIDSMEALGFIETVPRPTTLRLIDTSADHRCHRGGSRAQWGITGHRGVREVPSDP